MDFVRKAAQYHHVDPDTPIIKELFNEKNIYYIQSKLGSNVQTQTGYRIDKQNVDSIFQELFNTFEMYPLETADNVTRLTLKNLTREVVANVKDHVFYLKRMNNDTIHIDNPVPLGKPTLTRTTYTKKYQF